MWKKVLITLSATLALLCAVSSAWACSNYYTQAGEVFAQPIASTQDTIPSNFLFFEAHLYDQSKTPPRNWFILRGEEELELTFSLEEEFIYSQAKYQTTAYWWKPEQMILPGDMLARPGCESCSSFTITESDLLPPPTPEVEFRSIYQEDGSNLCAFGTLGGVSFNLRFDDEQQAQEDVLAKVYVGDTPEEARQASTPLNIQHVRASMEHIFSLLVVEETSDTLSLDKPFCISVVAVDAAGQESPRSTPLCIDPQFELHPVPLDEDDLEDPSCTTSPRNSPAPLGLLPLLLGLFWRWRSIHPRRRTTR